MVFGVDFYVFFFYNNQNGYFIIIITFLRGVMKVLMISLDKTILDKDSSSAARMARYSSICAELHIIIPNKKSAAKGRIVKLAENVFAHSTNSLSKIFFIFDICKIGREIMRTFGETPKVVTAQDPFETGFIGWQLAKKSGAGLEIQMHGDFYGSPYWRKENFLNRLRFYLGKFVLRRADVVRAVSRRIEKSVAPFVAKEKIKVIPVYSEEPRAGGVNLKEKFGRSPIILAVGNLVPVKNHELLITAFAEVKKDLPKAKLVIAGGGPLEKSLRLEANSLQLKDDVIFLGEQKNLAEIYKSADIFVHPSLYEGWGRAIVEAAHFGLPIIMSDVGLAGEVIKDGESGIIVPVNDVAALKSAILKLAKDEALCDRFGLAAKEAASRLSAKDCYSDKIKECWESAQKI
jgi:glycosyltransferase involved in cell wall biosynthesis